METYSYINNIDNFWLVITDGIPSIQDLQYRETEKYINASQVNNVKPTTTFV